MNIHEYQGKSILKSFGVAIQEGILAETPDQAVEAAKELKLKYNSDWVVVKAQIHAGGRGKGGGIKLAKNLDEVKEKASQILGMYLITPQTSAKGKLVNKVLITQDVYYKGASEIKEFYMSVLLNRAKGRNTIIYSTEGGMDIEHVAEHTPDKIWKEEIDPRIGIQAFQTRKIAFNLVASTAHFELAELLQVLHAKLQILPNANPTILNSSLKSTSVKRLSTSCLLLCLPAASSDQHLLQCTGFSPNKKDSFNCANSLLERYASILDAIVLENLQHGLYSPCGLISNPCHGILQKVDIFLFIINLRN